MVRQVLCDVLSRRGSLRKSWGINGMRLDSGWYKSRQDVRDAGWLRVGPRLKLQILRGDAEAP